MFQILNKGKVSVLIHIFTQYKYFIYGKCSRKGNGKESKKSMRKEGIKREMEDVNVVV